MAIQEATNPAHSNQQPPCPGSIDLCLSGGGFRATFFHLGVVRFLYEHGLLGNVRHLASVSGGSILAAHLVLKWSQYTGDSKGFDEAAAELVQFGQYDVRGRIVRRWVFAQAAFGASWVLKVFRRTRLLQSHYERLYGDHLLQDLAATQDVPRPSVHLLATSLTAGDLWSFSSSGAEIDGREGGTFSAAKDLPISRAVAASSAFPPLFPPVAINYDDDLKEDHGRFAHGDEYLTDGGIFDNVGIAKLLRLGVEKPADLVLLSDASAPFDWEPRSRFTFVVSRTTRATDILMKRVADLQAGVVGSTMPSAVRLSITRDVKPQEHAGCLPESVQRRVKHIRTDLDRFSPLEMNALVRHGYSVAAAVLLPVLRKGGAPGFSVQANRDLWLPVQTHPIPRVDKAERILKKSRDRSWLRTVWNPSDWLSFLFAGCAVGFLIATTYFGLIRPWQVEKGAKAANLAASGAQFARTGALSQAIDTYRESIRLDPSNPVAYNLAGYAFLKRGQLDSAKAYLTRSIEVDTAYPWARYNLALVQIAQSDTTGALANLSAVVRLSKGMGGSIATDDQLTGFRGSNAYIKWARQHLSADLRPATPSRPAPADSEPASARPARPRSSILRQSDTAPSRGETLAAPSQAPASDQPFSVQPAPPDGESVEHTLPLLPSLSEAFLRFETTDLAVRAALLPGPSTTSRLTLVLVGHFLLDGALSIRVLAVKDDGQVLGVVATAEVAYSGYEDKSFCADHAMQIESLPQEATSVRVVLTLRRPRVADTSVTKRPCRPGEA